MTYIGDVNRSNQSLSYKQQRIRERGKRLSHKQSRGPGGTEWHSLKNLSLSLVVLIIIIAVISIALYLTHKCEHNALI